MTSALISLLVHSVLIVLGSAVLFGAVVGGAAAQRTARPLTIGLLLGALLPGLGAALLLLPWTGRPAGAASPEVPYALPQPHVPGQLAVAPAAPVPHGSVPRVPPLPPRAGTRPGGTLPAVPAAATGASSRTWDLPQLTSADLGRTAIAVVASGVLLGAAVVPWYAVHTQYVDAGAFVSHGIVAPVPCTLAAVVVLAAAVAHLLHRRGRWAVLAAAIGSLCVLVALEVLVVTEALGRVVRHLERGLPAGASLRPATGAYLLLTAGLLTLCWATAVLPVRTPATGGLPLAARRGRSGA